MSNCRITCALELFVRQCITTVTLRDHVPGCPPCPKGERTRPADNGPTHSPDGLQATQVTCLQNFSSSPGSDLASYAYMAGLPLVSTDWPLWPEDVRSNTICSVHFTKLHGPCVELHGFTEFDSARASTLKQCRPKAIADKFTQTHARLSDPHLSPLPLCYICKASIWRQPFCILCAHMVRPILIRACSHLTIKLQSRSAASPHCSPAALSFPCPPG